MKPVTSNVANDQTRNQVLRIFEELTDKFETGWLYLRLNLSDAQNSEDAYCAADTDAKWEYRQATITVYLPTIAAHTDGQLRMILGHEIVHAIVAPMESLIKDTDANTRQCELAVESMTRTLLQAAGLELT